MYPYIHIGRFSVGTFGIMLWFAAVCAGWVLHRNFRRWKLDADAIGIVAISTVAGVVGAKLWHVLEDPQGLIQHPFLSLFDRADLPGLAAWSPDAGADPRVARAWPIAITARHRRYTRRCRSNGRDDHHRSAAMACSSGASARGIERGYAFAGTTCTPARRTILRHDERH